MGGKLEISIDIANVRVESVEINRKGAYVITVSSTEHGTDCHSCGRPLTKSSGRGRAVVLRHLPILGRKTYLRIFPVRYECAHCKGKKGKPVTSTQRLSWYDPATGQTKAYEEHVLLALVNSTVEDVSIKEDVGYEAIMGMIDRRIECKVDWKGFERLDVLGLDEIALKKGHQDFVSIVTAHVDGQINLIGVLADRNKETVKAFLSSIPKRLSRTIKAVCSDMYDGYINAAKEVFGKGIRVVVDRFHVAKLYRKSLDELRKKELRRLKKTLSAQEYKKLKGAMWILRKPKQALSEDESEVLACLFKHSPDLALAYQLCHELTEIFEQDIVKSRAKRKIKSWITRVKKSGLRCFNTFLSTLDSRMEDITNYFMTVIPVALSRDWVTWQC
jgi:transposase